MTRVPTNAILPAKPIRYPAKLDSFDAMGVPILYVCWWEWREMMWRFESEIFRNFTEGNQFYKDLNSIWASRD